jgi:hypothetical protein
MIHDDELPTILGIDPGLNGAAAWIFPPDRVEVLITPVLPAGKTGKRRFDIAAMVELLKTYPIDLAILEAVTAAPVACRVQGTASMFGFGRDFGLWEGILAALAISHQAVPPPGVEEGGPGRDRPGQAGGGRVRPVPVTLGLTAGKPEVPGPARRPGRSSLPG